MTDNNTSNSNYREELNDAQLDVVFHGEGPCLVLAGAGSGKTKTLVFRVMRLLEQGVDPSNIMLLTFTNKAAKEMLGRIERHLGREPKGIWGGTFHHIGNRMLRKYGELINIKSNFNILDEQDAADLIKSACKEVSLPADKYFPKASVIKSIISLSSNLGRPIAEVIAEKYDSVKEEYVSTIEQIRGLYEKKKSFANALDFDDLLIKWNELLGTNRTFRESLAKKFKYLLIDEYQDTNRIQNEIILRLSGPGGNVLAVGDDSQSIYAFRGADINNILEFPQNFPGCRVCKLETNYRSTPEILGLANRSIANNRGKFDKQLKAVRDGSAKPIVVAALGAREEAQFICQKILDLRSDEGLDLDRMAVLFRSHFASIEIELELSRRGIPYEMRGGLRFFEQAHVKDMLSYLKVISNPKDEVAWTRILLMQPGVGLATADKAWRIISSHDSLQSFSADPLVGIPAKPQKYLKELQKKLVAMAAETGDLPRVMDRIFNSLYYDYLKANYDNAKERAEDIEQLVEFSKKYESMEQFLADAALSEGFKGQRAAQAPQDHEEAVVLSTIHQAKGLEWDAVFVIGLNELKFPHARSAVRESDLEEERRLFYVAVTRAKEHLFLTYSLFGSDDNINRPSRFITELPSDSYRKHDDDDDGEVVYVDEDGEQAKPGRYLDFSL